MQLKNTAQRYGLVAILLHWLVAATVIGLAILGLWMTDLSYYSPYYRSAPFWHKSIGITFAAVLVLRLLWRWGNPRPAHLPNHQRWEVGMAAVVHGLLYLLLFVIVVSGYLISTAKGQGISVFGWFEIPASITGLPSQADRAGAVHYWVAITVLGLAALHALGALKHHFLDRDDTLRRMLGMRPRQLMDSKEKQL
ncbi:cytochrome b561 [Pseudomonas saudimassiliensis]|uniref:Cytochrome b561 n=1 Tax=Pseudomonas saudimassiliensis TaxID=1461581 RepID=A0A078MDT0_9PSED|nr:cytochrome b [Pseudomonas saudimassiliensis]CEA03617.1 cytochrome b561 [Pseudomonas saudimassiliensis]CEF26251.1 cytochrome b561 [Pseudomonas saudimassiliensis]